MDGDGKTAVPGLGACIFNYIECLQAANDCDSVVAEMGRQLALFGIDHFGLALHQAGSAAEFREGILVDCTNSAWTEHFFASGHADDNPSMDGRLNAMGPLYWSEFTDIPVYGARFGVMIRDAEAFGIREGFCVPIVKPGRAVGYATLQGKYVERSAEAKVAMHAIALFTFERLMKIRAQPAAEDIRLTPRETECLCWAAQGKTDWEIGEILGISETTVHWHIERAKQRFNVSTRVQAVVGAIQRGAISV